MTTCKMKLRSDVQKKMDEIDSEMKATEEWRKKLETEYAEWNQLLGTQECQKVEAEK